MKAAIKIFLLTMLAIGFVCYVPVSYASGHAKKEEKAKEGEAKKEGEPKAAEKSAHKEEGKEKKAAHGKEEKGEGEAAKEEKITIEAKKKVNTRDSTKYLKEESSKDFTKEDVALLKQLEGRRAELDKKEQILRDFEVKMQDEEKRLIGEMEKLKKLKEEVSALLEKKHESDISKLRKMIKVYENMESKKAAQVIQGLDESLAVEVLLRMKEKNAAQIINVMDREKAAKLSELMAGFFGKKRDGVMESYESEGLFNNNKN